MTGVGGGPTAGRGAWDQAGHAAREAAPWVKPAARIGLGAKGLVYLIIGLLAARAALGAGGETADSREALTTMLGQPFGRLLLGIVAFGLVGYTIWRLITAVADTEGKGSEAKGIAVRVSYAFRALLYGALGVEAARLALGGWGGGGSGGQGGEGAEHWAARVLDLPFGRWLLVLGGLGLAAYAVYQLYRAFSDKVKKHLDLHELGPSGAEWAVRVGRIGIAARAVVFAVMAWLLVRAGLDASAEEAGGVGDALATLGTAGTRPWLLAVVGVGLIAYGLYQFVHARYRRMSG
jgi:hypothetical protein